MNWKVGDEAILVNSLRGVHLGHVVEILGDHILRMPSTLSPAGTFGYRIMCCGKRYWCIPSWLKPIPDNYDGLELTKWSECPWQSEKVTVCL